MEGNILWFYILSNGHACRLKGLQTDPGQGDIHYMMYDLEKTWNSSEHLSTLNDHTGIKGRVSYCVAGCLFKRKVLISPIGFINVTIHHHLNLSKKCLSWRWSRLHQGDVRPLLISAAAALQRVLLRKRSCTRGATVDTSRVEHNDENIWTLNKQDLGWLARASTRISWRWIWRIWLVKVRGLSCQRWPGGSWIISFRQLLCYC